MSTVKKKPLRQCIGCGEMKDKRELIRVIKTAEDEFMLDVTGIDVKAGDIATMFGKDGSEKITADELADIYGTIGYEIICGISMRVPRVIMDDGKIINVIEYRHSI